MGAVTTGTFGINGTEFILQPSEGHWVPRNTLGIDGAGHPIYPGVREFELSWDIIDQATWNQLQNFYGSVANTGTCVANLPIYGNPQFSYQPYSGCTIGEPEVAGSFLTQDGYLQQVKVVILNIKGT
jgi:hypothetical protein